MGVVDKVVSTIKGQIPDRLFNLGTAGKKLIKSPIRFIIAVVIALFLEIVDGIASVINSAVTLLTTPADLFGSVLTEFASPIVTVAFTTVDTWNRAIATTVTSAGPGAPVALVVVYGIEIYLLYRLVSLTPVGRVASQYFGSVAP